MLVVIGVVILVVPSIFVIIFGIMREQTKIYRLSIIKKEGDFILNNISNLIKSRAITIHSANPPTEINQVCAISDDEFTSSNDRIFFTDPENNWFRILWSSNVIASYSSFTASSVNLNSSNAIIENFSIGCERASTYSGPTVSISFEICYKTSLGSCTSTRPEETATMYYQTKIKLRNY